jgi:hypothetical protein
MISHREILELFSDEKFEGQNIEQIFAASTDSDGTRLRLVVVVIPSENMLMYRVESANDDVMITTNFQTALRTFRELL